MYKNSQRGSTTVEAALILPVIFLGIIAILYISIIHYQNIATSAAVMRSANRISVNWQHIDEESPTVLNETNEAELMLSKENFAVHDPYRFIIDGKKGKREENGRKYALRLAGEVPKFYTNQSDNKEMQVNKTGNFFIHYIEVSTNKSYTNPLGGALESFGVGAGSKDDIKAKTVLTSSTEFIRNIGFINELVKGK